MANKCTDVREAFEAALFDGATIAVGGFGTCGLPLDLIEIVRSSKVRELTVVSNNLSIDGVGLGCLLEEGQVSRVKASYIGENKLFMEKYLSGEIDLEFVPQGTLAERMRAGGSGIAGFYTKTGVGTEIGEGKETREFDGETFLFETAIKADFGLVRAYEADRSGNLRYRLTARNFNPLVAMCGKTTFAEAENIVAKGELGPDDIHTPGVFVDHLLQAETPSVIEHVVNSAG
ncbi:succinyl-CoA--3-ketoacid-CoA transferase [Corynebacterium sp. HMSC068H04]|uniref:CoA transferase subunit A n=1 Tax=Corynebacterium sp. HMSC068H04 TaxID=1739296 RepID=UPI0008A3A7C4|nr:CoA transferase subunit A [Corynebacterium sp. HMSC068H04]OFK92565.1 succinyl-CoA--3-ketoacid-CoA transferase [Corynebacterium sp. HMSC068H04]